jgi:methionine-rich copper-binding protein CopC
LGIRQRRRLLIVLWIIAALLVGASTVSAHARLKTADPADKSTVAKAPAQITLTFSEETSATKSGGSVTDASGATVSTGFKVDLDDRTKMTIALRPDLPGGAYTVKWNTFTEDDSGMADGTVTFTVQAGAAAGTTAAGSASAAATIIPVSATRAPTAPPTASAPVVTAPPTSVVTPRAAGSVVATGAGGGVATPAPTTLPGTGKGDSVSSPWLLWSLVAGAVIVVAGLGLRLRMARSE